LLVVLVLVVAAVLVLVVVLVLDGGVGGCTALYQFLLGWQ
jgi:hypothetical protein